MFFVLGVTLIILFYYYYTKNFDYWKKRGVKYEKPVILVGNYGRNFLMQQSRSLIIDEVYWKYPEEKVVGLFRASTPELVIRDPELVKKVLISDFYSFYRRGFNPYRHKIEPVMRNVFILEGDLWKMLRNKITPAFSSSKLKATFPLIVDRAEKLQERTYSLLKTNPSEPIDARDLMARYTIDFIGTVGFSLDADTLNDEESEFRKLGFDIFNLGFKDFVFNVLKEIFPALCQDLKMFGRVENRVLNLVKQIQDSRDNKPSGKNDFIDQLLEYKQKGPIEIESIEKVSEDGTPKRVTLEFDDILIAAQVFVFFAAGFETTSSTTSYTLHQLAFNPEKQLKVQREIDAVLAKHDNKLSYESIKEMTYLDWAFKEAMRLFPALGHLMRECTGKYTFSDINLTIDEDVRICVPVTALHMDPLYWDNPKEYRPERFHTDNFTATQKSVYFPFGEGPRGCIGK